MTLDNLLTERFARNPTIVRLLNKYPDPPNKDIGEGLNTVFAKMAEAKLTEPKIQIDGGTFVVTLGHTPLARPREIVIEYLESHDEIKKQHGTRTVRNLIREHDEGRLSRSRQSGQNREGARQTRQRIDMAPDTHLTTVSTSVPTL
ncbi:MAG TPA: ATP-binding protein [Solirubrobacteraceae bacterium]|jgi:ATP-dependent DNA helicase RecG|nr:ATP-binding protein [Solirubrobacteraceae bacterium]